jgi:DNA-binding Xre family transcriptional regulator
MSNMRVLAASWVPWERCFKVTLAGGRVCRLPLNALREAREPALAQVCDLGGGVEVVFTDGTWTDFGGDFAVYETDPSHRRNYSPSRPTDWGAVAGRRVRQLRKARGWSAQKLAEMSGIAQPNIIRLERGRHEPRTSTLARVAEALEVDLQELLRPERS